MIEILQVVTATAAKEEADRLALGLVQARLAASAQVDGPIDSIYWWQGKATSAEEWRVTIKTPVDRYEELEAFIVDHHSYDTPGILATPVARGSEKYLKWVVSETRRSV